ncbi:MAG: class I SAM-dependent methyltransferase [Candidatus Taylorbacteria bacterium]|nr:class I SAM-dependent methyltransferase [Candidatus Taylorbacteria bacterium]
MDNIKKDLNKVSSSKKINDTSWNKVAGWYDEMLESGEGTYQKDLILPNVLRLLDVKKGEKVLDLGCGQGFFSREVFKVGAEVVGVDLSKNLIDLAIKHSPKEIKFVVAPADKLGFVDGGTQDAVLCISAIQNVKNVAGLFSESFRTLKIGGRMLIVMNHPAFRIPKRTSWGFDEVTRFQYRRVDEYLSESVSEINMTPGSDSFVSTVSFHHPLQFYFKALTKAGFLIGRLEEWNSGKTSQPGPRANAENKARKEFPLFLTLEVIKFKA